MVLENSPTGLTAIGNTLYMTGNEFDALFAVNTTTGIATRIGNANQFGASISTPTGLGAIGELLYMTDNGTDAIYTVNPRTGVASRIGSATSFGANVTIPRGLAFMAS